MKDLLNKYLTVICFLFAFCLSLPAQTYHIYVTSESEDEVSVVSFDGEKAWVSQVIPVGYMPTEIEGPHGITVSPDGKYWYLSMAHGMPYGKVYKFTTGENEIVGTTELGLFPASMQISNATGLLFVVNFNLHGKMTPSSVSVVDPETMTELTKVTTGSMPHGSRITPDGLHQYSVAMMSGELFEISTLDLKVSRVLDLEKKEEMDHSMMDHSKMDHSKMDHSKMGHNMDDMKGMKHSNVKPTWVIPHPKERKVFIAGNGSNELLEIDLDKWEVTHRMETGKGPYNVELTPDGNLLVATYKSEGTTAIWDLKTRKEVGRVKNSRRVSHGIAISPDSKYAFVSVEGVGAEPGSVDVIDLQKRKRVAFAEVGKQAGGIAFWKIEE